MRATLTSPGDGPARRDLYRFFDAEGRLLYIGISLNAAARASTHSKSKAWWPEVATMTVEHFENITRRDMERVEAAVIRLEAPAHNVVHSVPKHRPGAITSVAKGWPISILPVGSPVEIKRGSNLVRGTVARHCIGATTVQLDDEWDTRDVSVGLRVHYIGRDVSAAWLEWEYRKLERRTA